MTEQVYRDQAGEAVSFPYTSPRTGQKIPSFNWFAGDEENNPAKHDLTGPHTVTSRDEVEYDPDTQRVVMRPDGEWVAIALTAQEIEDKKPKVVTMRQARAALILTGNLHLVQPAIDAIEDDTERLLAQNEWDYSSTVERERGLTQLLGSALFTDEQLDQLFVLASQQA